MTFTRYFKIISMRYFVQFILSSLDLSGVRILNKVTPFSFLEVLDLEKAHSSRHYNTFFRDNKVTNQIH